MNRGEYDKGNSPFRWQNTRLEKDLLNKIDSGVDRCSEHSLNICRTQPSGPGDLSVISSSNNIEVVIIVSSNLGN